MFSLAAMFDLDGAEPLTYVRGHARWAEQRPSAGLPIQGNGKLRRDDVQASTHTNRLKGKITVVTGAASGLGAAIAQRLAVEGARVIVTDVQATNGQKLARELDGDFALLDVTNEQQWASAMLEIKARHGGLHVIVNNAGIEGPFDAANPESTRLQDWQAIHRVNVEGVFLGCRAAIPLLRDSGGGAIINVASTASLVATPDFVAYGASKAAVQHLTKSVALHCARNGSKVRCNSVHPGTIMTAMMRRILQDIASKRGVSYEQVLEETRAAMPQGEFQEPDDVANAVSFLAGDEARHITGVNLPVDGGITLSIASATAARIETREPLESLQKPAG